MSSRGYGAALEAAGAIVHDFEHFGSYQGDWLADVTVNDARGFIRGSYGSCSGCDAFESEFGYSDEEKCDEHRYDYSDASANCTACAEHRLQYEIHLAAFGRGYFDFFYTREEMIKQISENLEWDSEAQTMIDWINRRPETIE